MATPWPSGNIEMPKTSNNRSHTQVTQCNGMIYSTEVVCFRNSRRISVLDEFRPEKSDGFGILQDVTFLTLYIINNYVSILIHTYRTRAIITRGLYIFYPIFS